ncbi:hypothetical protein ACIQU1_29510 [Streptomyces angustmyceticus]|uniref:hypothetical protein n=1 Tax=Streptomyces angustmyceticus TaxID=285578 RepID=UPI00344C8D2B
MNHVIAKYFEPSPGDGDAAGHSGSARLLPWANADGNPCYLVGDGTGYVSRIADSVECLQLDMADGLLGHAEDMLACPQVTSPELRFLARGLTDALRDVRRIAESRGARLPAPDQGLGEGEDRGGAVAGPARPRCPLSSSGTA